MDINQLILIIKKKLKENILIEKISVEDKTFLHKKHQSHQAGKFHLKLIIRSSDLNKQNKIKSTKRIYSILSEEMKKYIHSIQILIS
jgi:BolA family transcriptional regulator, general stress-responsive regulator